MSKSFIARSKSPFFLQASLANPPFPSVFGRTLDLPTLRLDLLQWDLQNPYTLQYNLTVQREVHPILITGQPQDVIAVAGFPVSFSVTASSTLPLSFQWQHNGVDLPGHSAVLRVPARDLDAQSDLVDRLVTREVGHLTNAEVVAALERGLCTAESLQRRGLIHSAALHLRGETRVILQPGTSFHHVPSPIGRVANA